MVAVGRRLATMHVRVTAGRQNAVMELREEFGMFRRFPCVTFCVRARA